MKKSNSSINIFSVDFIIQKQKKNVKNLCTTLEI